MQKLIHVHLPNTTNLVKYNIYTIILKNEIEGIEKHIKKISLKKQALFTIYEKCDIISQNEVH